MTALNANDARLPDAGPSTVNARLSAMMFVQFFIWGAWYVTMGPFMAAHGMGEQIGVAYTLGPIAAIISPFFLGMIADRFFASQRVLGVMHLLGAAAMFAIPSVIPATVPNAADPDGAPLLASGASATAFLALVFVHSLCYMPTINLTNSVAFANLTDQEKQFPYVRVFGTFGWIAAGLLVSLVGVDETVGQFQIAAAAAVVMAVYSFFLPHTPPPAKGKAASVRQILGLDALALLKHRSFAVFALSSFLICIPLAAYYGYAAGTVKTALLAMAPPEKAAPSPATTATTTEPATTRPTATASASRPATRPATTRAATTQAATTQAATTQAAAAKGPKKPGPPVAAWMSIGQGAEVFFMLIMPFFFRKLGVKWMLAVGMLAWVVRYGLFAAGITGPTFGLIILGVALHGICYDFFFVTGFIYTDKRAAKQITGQAQGLIVLLTYGVGLAIGGYVSGLLFNAIVGKATGAAALPLLEKFWVYPAACAGVVFLIFTLLFRDDTNDPRIGGGADGAVARGEANAALPGTGA